MDEVLRDWMTPFRRKPPGRGQCVFMCYLYSSASHPTNLSPAPPFSLISHP